MWGHCKVLFPRATSQQFLCIHWSDSDEETIQARKRWVALTAPTHVSDSLLGWQAAIGETVVMLQETTEMKKWKEMQYIKHIFILILSLLNFVLGLK